MSTVTHTPLAIWLSRSKFDYTVTYTFAGLGNADGPQLTVTHKTVPGQTIYGPPVTRLLLRTISCVSATTLTCPISLVLPRYPRSKVYCLLACFARWRRLHRYTRLDFRPSGQSGVCHMLGECSSRTRLTPYFVGAVVRINDAMSS